MTTSPQVRQVETVRFGQVAVESNAIIEFVRPILGFEHLKEFALFDHDEDSPFKWLQSLEDPNLAFVVTNPTLFGLKYEFHLPSDACELLGLQSAEDTQVLTIVTIPDDVPAHMTANLLAPIVFHNDTHQAMQIVIEGEDAYTTKVRLIPDQVIKADGLIDLDLLTQHINEAD
jgi:flagellar assembly factor FliW